MNAFVSVYVDMAARADDVRVAVAQLPTPDGVLEVKVDGDAITDTFGCRIAVDLTGTFDERTEGLASPAPMPPISLPPLGSRLRLLRPAAARLPGELMSAGRFVHVRPSREPAAYNAASISHHVLCTISDTGNRSVLSTVRELTCTPAAHQRRRRCASHVRLRPNWSSRCRRSRALKRRIFAPAARSTVRGNA
ncbi:MAG: hypothetical protein QOI25_991 [Mycobacterium sp.]|nr:hypothetical protein [Mycobacterium sp.]